MLGKGVKALLSRNIFHSMKLYNGFSRQGAPQVICLVKNHCGSSLHRNPYQTLHSLDVDCVLPRGQNTRSFSETRGRKHRLSREGSLLPVRPSGVVTAVARGGGAAVGGASGAGCPSTVGIRGDDDEGGSDDAELDSNRSHVPLVERRGVFQVSMMELVAWREAAARQAEQASEEWSKTDDEGPSGEDLMTELDWLLDDAVAACVPASKDEEGIQEECSRWSWREAQRAMRSAKGPDPALLKVTLRESLQSLDKVWNSRLSRREPLQYLTSTAFWRSYILSVGPGVLIPRPETELIVDFVREAANENFKLAQGNWADLGTGSGALAIALATELPEVNRVYAVDVADEPCYYTSLNAQRLGVSERIKVLQGSWFEPLRAHRVTRLAGIVSNPPYIPSNDLPGLQAEVSLHEPWLALDGGEGLAIDCLVAVCRGAVEMLCPGGFLAVETGGDEQSEYLAQLLNHFLVPDDDSGSEVHAFKDVKIREDLRGVKRFVTAIRGK